MRQAIPMLLLTMSVACGEARDVVPVRLEEVSVIGAEQGEGALAGWPRVSPRHPLGYRVLVPQSTSTGALPAVYDDNGRFLGLLGVRGDGAEHFSEPLFVRFGPGDSLYVFDGARRVLIFSPDRQYVRTMSLPVIPWDAVVLGDGRVVVSSALHEHPLPLVVLRPDGTTEREIGASDSASMRIPSPRRVVLASDGSIWTMPMAGRWRLEHWSADGALVGVIDRAPDWYAPYGAAVSSTGGEPRPTLQDAWFDATGRLWVLGKAVDAKWKDGVDDDSTGTRAVIDDPDKVGDTMLEVFDPTGAAVLVTARIDQVYPFAVEPGMLMRVKSGGSGSHRAALARIVMDTTKFASKP